MMNKNARSVAERCKRHDWNRAEVMCMIALQTNIAVRDGHTPPRGSAEVVVVSAAPYECERCRVTTQCQHSAYSLDLNPSDYHLFQRLASISPVTTKCRRLSHAGSTRRRLSSSTSATKIGLTLFMCFNSGVS
ncbi:hypothetical protein AVEN_187590-1 [Araneus ventricosus]|uniref:Uncharacterized protein n=1 Tax=Araneus ventricosus TaxID=182803 RepID=A0A4Y2FR83_ARAVE|nr:hypothetical protein AVEN_187590-1 [Araneus ventricosus]